MVSMTTDRRKEADVFTDVALIEVVLTMLILIAAGRRSDGAFAPQSAGA